MAFFKLFGAVCRCCSAKYRELWLVCERGNDARDNGYWFYRYLKEEHPEINARYVIETDSADRAKIEALGGMVPRGSFSHYLAYYCADFLVGTHVQPCAPDLILFYHLAGKGIRARGKQVFLQHGIIKDEMEWLHRKNMYMDLFVCGAKPEYEYIRDTFGYPEHVPQYVGLARFDNLIRAERKEKMILVMPTWRGSHYPTGEAFRNTAYYEHFQSLLCCKELEQLLEQQDYRLVFYPHIEMQKDSRRFKSGSDRITIVSKETHDVQKLLMDCALLVTDYSSVFFDVAFLRKPVVYYQFDEEEFRKYHYQKGYFDFRRDGFGPVCTTQEALLEALTESFENGMEMRTEYAQRTERFFPLHDGNNCRRSLISSKTMVISHICRRFTQSWGMCFRIQTASYLCQLYMKTLRSRHETGVIIMNIPEMADLPKKPARTGYSHIAFSVGSIEKVDELTAELKADGYEVISGPRTTGDGYYESCIVAVEDNQIEITV